MQVIVVIPAVNVRSWCCAAPKSRVTTLLADGDDAVVLTPAAIVIVDPAPDAVTVAPAKSRETILVPLDTVSSFTSTPETTPSRLLPSP